MDSLPIELLRLILSYCDLESVRCLRLVTPTLADVAYEYLIPPLFHAVPWRDDLTRLRGIAGHDRLHASIEAISFNFTEIHAENARHIAYCQNCRLERERQNALLTRTWKSYAHFERLRRKVPAFTTHDVDDVAAALRPLTNLRHLDITFKRSPYDLEVLHRALSVPECSKMDHAAACKTLGLLLAGLQEATATSTDHDSDREGSSSEDDSHCLFKLATFSVDRLPLEMFKQPSDRRLWFQSGNIFANLRRLNLALDTSNATYPSARFKAVNGLGYVLRLAPHLTHLSLAFHNYARPRDKFVLSFLELLGDGSFGFNSRTPGAARGYGGYGGVGSKNRFCYSALTDLKLENIACDERELCVFLLRHAATLERLRFGGRGMSRTAYEPPTGGISLFNGNFRSLFRNLRGRMPRLQRLHLEGDFECETMLSNASESPTASNSTDDEAGDTAAHPVGGHTRYERYMFYATTDDNWDATPPVAEGLRNSTLFEEYVLGITNTYPEVHG